MEFLFGILKRYRNFSLKNKFSLTVFTHIVLHNLIKVNLSSKIIEEKKSTLSKTKHLNIIDQLEDYVSKFSKLLKQILNGLITMKKL